MKKSTKNPKHIEGLTDLIANIVTEVMGTDKEVMKEPTKEQRMLLGRWNKENKILDIRSVMVLKRNGDTAPKETKRFKNSTFMRF